MPRVYRARIPVPEYEIDGFGELFPSTLARFLQQVAIEASTDAGFSDAWYTRAGTIWVIRRSTIEYREPALSGDVVEISTHVADFRRVRSRREYEARRLSTGEPIAAAHTDWVYVDRSSGRPARIPPEMIEGFHPGGEAASSPREPLDLPAPPPGASAMERRVTFREIDGVFHVNNAAYVDFVEEATLSALAARGWPLERLLAAGGYLRPALHDVEYLQEARHGELIRCATWPGPAAGERFCDVVRERDGTRLTRSRSRWQWVELATRAAAELPPEVADALAG